MTFSIRPAKKTDAPAWAAMRHALWPEASAGELARELAPLMKGGRYKGWIASLDGVPVGFAEANIREFANGCDSRPVAFLEGIWVEKSHRKRGLGKRLVRAVELWAASKGIKELGSDAYLGNRLSKRCHLGWGFKETERVVYFRKKLKGKAG